MSNIPIKFEKKKLNFEIEKHLFNDQMIRRSKTFVTNFSPVRFVMSMLFVIILKFIERRKKKRIEYR